MVEDVRLRPRDSDQDPAGTLTGRISVAGLALEHGDQSILAGPLDGPHIHLDHGSLTDRQVGGSAPHAARVDFSISPACETRPELSSVLVTPSGRSLRLTDPIGLHQAGHALQSLR